MAAILSRGMWINGIAHPIQGWVTEDQTLVLLDDELDETYGVGPDSSKTGHTITYLWDVTDLDNPELKSHYISTEVAIDHNQYIIGDLTYQVGNPYTVEPLYNTVHYRRY